MELLWREGEGMFQPVLCMGRRVPEASGETRKGNKGGGKAESKMSKVRPPSVLIYFFPPPLLF